MRDLLTSVVLALGTTHHMGKLRLIYFLTFFNHLISHKFFMCDFSHLSNVKSVCPFFFFYQ